MKGTKVKRILLLLLVLVLMTAFVAVGAPTALAAQSGGNGDISISSGQGITSRFAEDHVIVGLKEGCTSLASAFSLSKIGSTSIRDLTRVKSPKGAQKVAKFSKKVLLVKLGIKSKEGVMNAITNLKKDPNVAYAEPDYIVSIKATPNDPDYDELYGMELIEAPDAWSLCTGSSSVVVGVIDSGIDYNHPDLANNIWTNPGEIAGNSIDDDGNGYVDDIHGWDFCNDDNNPMDDNNHGTHCAGTIGAKGNNSTGVAGVCWTVRLAALKFLSYDGFGFTSDAIEAVNYATAMDFPITNNSWGGGAYSQALHDAIADSGLFVAAAGNAGQNNDYIPHYPSSYDCSNIIAVAATGTEDELAGFSNRGPTTVDLAAPGVFIYSTLPSNSYGEASGTSMAAPHVSGAAALLLAYQSTLTTAQLKDRILDNVDPLPDQEDAASILSGGRLNVYEALTGNNDNEVTIYYKRGFTTPYIHYKQANGQWTTAPGVAMTASTQFPGYSVVENINMGSYNTLEACFNNGNGNWDSNNGNNYFFPPGVYTYDSGNITQGFPPTLIPVTFTVNNATTYWGQNVYIAGNISLLGSWAPANAVGPASCPNYPTWVITINLPANQAIEFKAIKKDGGNVVWEGGSNHTYTVPGSGTGNVTVTWQN